MKVLFSPYRLRFKNSDKVQEGALIKIEDGTNWGVADVSPHPHLGDPTWSSEIKKEGSLYRRAIELAREDLVARSRKVSLLQDKWVQNNIIVLNYDDFDFSRYPGAMIKLKMGRQVKSAFSFLNHLKADVRLRLDFNLSLTAEEFDLFLNGLKPEAIKKIDYIEDPCAAVEHWPRWNSQVRLAADFVEMPPDDLTKYVRVLKPSREPTTGFRPFDTLTSAMEHPVGFAHALRMAQNLATERSLFGFSTLSLFEPTEYHQYFIDRVSEINFSNQVLFEYGIGMDQTLAKMRWLNLDEALL